jgi:hypothetical protein
MWKRRENAPVAHLPIELNPKIQVCDYLNHRAKEFPCPFFPFLT